MMQYEHVSERRVGNTAFVALKRPAALNAIDMQMAVELVAVLDRMDDDEEVRCVVLTGVGDRAFSVGQDVEEMLGVAQGVDDRPTLTEVRKRLGTVDPWQRLAVLSKPTVAAVNGLAMSGGLELALACDIRLAADTASFGFPEVRMGIIPSHGGTQRLARIVGRAKAIELLVTGETIDAVEALRIELVSRLVPAAELEGAAAELAERLAKYGPLALRFAREAVLRGLDMTSDQGLHLETDLYALLQTTEDRLEGLRAFREKREPKFKGH